MSAMGRKRTQLRMNAAQRAELQHCLERGGDARQRERARWALEAASGRHTLEELARQTGRARATIQNWLGKFKAGGVAGLLERETPPGVVSPLAQPRLQAELRMGFQAGRWASAAEVATWLRDQHGIKRARKSIYYWLNLNGWTAPGARSGKPDREGGSRGRS